MSLRNCVIAGILFAVVFGVLATMSDGLLWGILNGVLAGTLFGGLLFLGFNKDSKQTTDEPSP